MNTLSVKAWVSPYNFIDEVRKDFSLPQRVRVYDTTLRDGEQVPGLVFRMEDKIRIAQLLDELGVQRIEAGFPTVSQEDKDAVKKIANLGLQSEIWGFARCVKSDIDACIECDVKGVVCEIAVSDLKMKAYNFKEDYVLERIVETVSYAKDHGLTVAFFGVDASRASLGFLQKAYTAAVGGGGADEVVVVDTLGVTIPEAMYYLTSQVRRWVKAPVHVHCHNDFGLATACTLAAVKAGAEWVHVTVNGLGEKAGNADLAEVTLALLLLYNVDVGLRYDRIYKTSKIVEQLSRVRLPPMKPVTGDAVFKRESGVAVLQLLKYPPSIESYEPELIGRRREIVLGKKSGAHSISWKLKSLGLSASDSQIKAILQEVKQKAMEKRDIITDEEFMEIAKKHLSQ